METEQIEPPKGIAKKLLPGEEIIYFCKTHKIKWILPLVFMLGCLSFIHSYPDMDAEIRQCAYILLAMASVFFALNVFIYNTVGIFLTNKRLIIKKSFTSKAIKLEDVGILKYKDAVEVMKEIKTREQIKRKRSDVIIGVFFDVVEVKIINKDGYEYASLDSIGLLNFKHLKKLFDAECEKRESILF